MLLCCQPKQKKKRKGKKRNYFLCSLIVFILFEQKRSFFTSFFLFCFLLPATFHFHFVFVFLQTIIENVFQQKIGFSVSHFIFLRLVFIRSLFSLLLSLHLCSIIHFATTKISPMLLALPYEIYRDSPRKIERRWKEQRNRL